VIEFLAFRLDTINQCLWKHTDRGKDERIRLAPRPFALLRYLVENPGRLVTEDEILGAVWPKLYIQPESIKTQLHHIRKVLGDDPKCPRYIETVPRRGHQFIAPVREALAFDTAVPTRSTQQHVFGRDSELSELRDHLSAASRGERQVVFVTGEPGIGKTALVDEFERQAASEVPAIRIGRGLCIEAYGGTEAYYPILEALGQLCVGPAAASIVEVLAAQAPTWLVQFPALLTERHREILRLEIQGATRERMLRELGTALDVIAQKTPLLLKLEDLQWVDHSTVDAMSMLARRRSSARLMLIATSRPIALLPSDHPLKALKQDLLLRQQGHRIQLKPLTEAQVAECLRADSPHDDLPKGLAEFIYRRSDGNPLFMRVTLDDLTQRGFIAKDPTGWQVKVPLEGVDLEVPETLRQVIETQIERLSVEEQRALEAASVQGAAFSTGICAAVVDGDAEEYENLYHSMVHRRRLVRIVGSQQYPTGGDSARCEFVHALYRDVLYWRQPPSRRKTLHRRVGERLEMLYSGHPYEVAAELAHHFEKSSDWPRTIKYLQLAAEASKLRCGHREAIALLERALSLASKLPAEQRALKEIETLEALASILYLSEDTSASRFEELASHASQCGVIDVEVRALTEAGILWSWSDSKRGLELLDEAERLNARQADPLARASARMKCMYGLLLNGRRSATDVSEARDAISGLRSAGLLTGDHLTCYANLLMTRSDYRESRRCALEGIALLAKDSRVNPCADRSQINAAYVLCNDELFLGELGEALRVVEATVAALTRNGNEAFAHMLRLWSARLSVVAHDFEGALTICESVARALSDVSHLPAQHLRLAITGTAEVALGRYEQALELLALARHNMDRQPVLNDLSCNFLVESALTELWLAKGDLAKASVQGERLLKISLETEERTWQALSWDVNARVAMAEGNLAHAEECIVKASATMEVFEIPLAAWRVHATAAALCDRMGSVGSAERHRQISRATILKIADSLAPEEPLRKTFLSAAPVAEILRTSARGQPSVTPPAY
jgi:DNA-binding winged helix-turn-helix (wHTH) protein